MSKKEKEVKKTGIHKEYKCSSELRELIGHKHISRGQMMQAVWDYIKKHKLQDKKNKRNINPDKVLGKVLGNKTINMFAMTKKLSEHLS